MLETSWAVNKIGRKTYNENYYSKPHKTLSTISNEFPQPPPPPPHPPPLFEGKKFKKSIPLIILH